MPGISRLRHRWLRNLALLYLLLLAAGTVTGLVDALGAHQWVIGQDVQIIERHPDGSITSEPQDPDPGFGLGLIFFPLLLLALGTVFAVPVALLGWPIAALLSRSLAYRTVMRTASVLGFGLVGLFYVAGGKTGFVSMMGAALIAYGVLAELPEARVAQQRVT